MRRSTRAPQSITLELQSGDYITFQSVNYIGIIHWHCLGGGRVGKLIAHREVMSSDNSAAAGMFTLRNVWREWNHCVNIPTSFFSRPVMPHKWNDRSKYYSQIPHTRVFVSKSDHLLNLTLKLTPFNEFSFSVDAFIRRWLQAHSHVLSVSSLFEIDIIKTEQNLVVESCPHLFCTRELWTACLEQQCRLNNRLIWATIWSE